MRVGAKEGGKVDEKKRKSGKRSKVKTHWRQGREERERKKNSPFDLSVGEGGGR